jgi:hypothetical protein
MTDFADLDDAAVERLLVGDVEPADAPEGWSAVAVLLRAAAEVEPVEGPSAELLASLVAAAPGTSWSRHDGGGVVARRRIGAAVFGATLLLGAGTGVAAATGSLPGPIQGVIHDVADAVGLDVPDRDDADADETEVDDNLVPSPVDNTDDAPGRPANPGRSEDAPGQDGETGRPDDPGNSEDAPGQDGTTGRPDDAGRPADAGRPEDPGQPGPPPSHERPTTTTTATTTAPPVEEEVDDDPPRTPPSNPNGANGNTNPGENGNGNANPGGGNAGGGGNGNGNGN